MTKYDEKVMDVIVNGEKVGELVKKNSAEGYASKYWSIMKIQREFKKMVKNSKNKFITPIKENK